MVGFIQFALGALHLGAIVSFISHPVIVGFTNAAAIIIGLSQLNKLLGVSVGRSSSFLADIWGVLEQIRETHLPTLAIGVAAFALMYGLRRYRPKWPGVLIAVLLTTVVSWGIGFERNLQATIADLADEDARALAVAYAEDTKTILGIDRAIEAKTTEIQATKGSTARDEQHRLTLDYQVQTLRLERRALESENRLRVRALRRFHFVQSAEGGGLHAFGSSGADTSTGTVRWRIQKIDGDRLFLAGGGEVVGEVPQGLPEFQMPSITLETVRMLLSSALVIALVAFMEAVSIAKAMATWTRQRIDPNQELIGQGLANIVGSFSQCYPASGSFSRSAVNFSAGAVTGMSSVFTAVVVLVTLLFLTPLLYHLPQSVLAAVIMLAVVGLINFRAMKHAWQAHRHDGIAAIVTFAATLIAAPNLDVGILVGAALAIVLFLYRTMAPRVAILDERTHRDPALRRSTLLRERPALRGRRAGGSGPQAPGEVRARRRRRHQRDRCLGRRGAAPPAQPVLAGRHHHRLLRPEEAGARCHAGHGSLRADRRAEHVSHRGTCADRHRRTPCRRRQQARGVHACASAVSHRLEAPSGRLTKDP
jgi:SulP family sulfate permease